MTAAAKKENYKTARFSAKEIWLHDFKDIYVEILRQCDIMGCLEAVSHQLIEQMGFHYQDIPDEMRFIDYLSQMIRAMRSPNGRFAPCCENFFWTIL